MNYQSSSPWRSYSLPWRATRSMSARRSARTSRPSSPRTKPAPRAISRASPARRAWCWCFFRSAKWCPFCQAQLVSLKDVAAPLAARGYGLAAISYDPPTVLHDYAEKRDVRYTLLSDEGSKTIDAWNLRDPQYPTGHFAYGVPRPSIFVISSKGVIKAKLALEGYKVRPDNAAILAAVDGVE